MSGVRFLSIVMAIGASFLWGGFVVNTWYKNGLKKSTKLESPSQKHLPKNADLAASKSNAPEIKQEIKQAKKPEKKLEKKPEQKIAAVDETLQHADAMALAASEEFNKATEQISKLTAPEGEHQLNAKQKIETDKKPTKLALARENTAEPKQKPKKSTPKSKPIWLVPDGVTPQYVLKPVKKAAPAKKAIAAKKKQPKQVAQKTKDTKKDGASKSKPIWVVPDGVSPHYVLKPATKQIAQKTKDIKKESAPKSKPIWVVPDGATPHYAVKTHEEVTPVKEEVASKTVKKKPVWVVPDGVTPEYDKFTAIEVGSIPWQIPMANDPIDVNPVKAKIKEIATGVKDSASVAAGKVGEKLSSLANEVKEKIEGDDKWVVPTGVQPSYKERDYVRDEGSPIWSVPDAITPSYAHRDEPKEKIISKPADKTVLAKLKSKLAKKKLVVAEQKVTEQAINNKIENRLGDGDGDGDAQPTTRRPQINQDKDGTRLSQEPEIASKSVSDDQPSTNENVQKSVTENKNDKSAKTRVAVGSDLKPLVDDNPKSAKQDKEQSLEKNLVTKDKTQSAQNKIANNKKAADPKPIWVVPTGADPQVSVVAQLERGLETVKQVAEDASNEIAKKVTSLGTNVKEAVASTQKWEVPTGANWNDGKPENEPLQVETKQAQIEDGEIKEKIAKQEPLVTALVETQKDPSSKEKSSKAIATNKQEEETSKGASKDDAMPLPIKKEITLAALPKKKDAVIPMAKKVIEDDADIFVSSKMNPIGQDVKVAAKEDGESVPKNEETKKNITPKKVYNRILEIIDTVKNGKSSKKKTDPNKVSGLDKARFAALKVLMVDDVKYKFTDIKKGEGEIKISGRSQSGSKLALYIGEHRYLGNVVSNDKGEWSFEKSLYLPKGSHVIQAQQMSKSGLVLAKKTMPLKQTIAARPPKDFAPDVGINLDDKDLKVVQDKLKEKNLPKRKLASQEPDPAAKPVAKDSNVKAPKVKDQKVKTSAKAEQKLANLQKPAKGQEKAEVKTAPLIKEAVLKTKPDQEKAKAEQPQETIYIVQRGDTVKKIAKKIYGDSKRFKEIVQLNPNLPKNNMIHPNQKLIIKAQGQPLVKKDVKAAVKETKEVKLANLDTKKTGKVMAKDAVKTTEENAKEANTIPVPKQDITSYIVRKGDTLSKIAQKIYGNANRYKELFKLNPKLRKNGLIHPKQRLVVQASGKSDKKEPGVKVAAVKTKKATKVKETKETSKPVKETKETGTTTGAEFYKVKSGDNLWKIAKKVYGNGAQFGQLIKLNPKLGKNPKLIQPNVKLRVRSTSS